MLMMLPFEAPTIFEGIHKSYFRMPRVVKDQRQKFDNDDLFRQLAHESAVKYTGFKDRPLEERQMKFIANCQEGHTEVSVVQSGNQFTLMFNPAANPAYNSEGCDFDKELGKVHIKSGFILNGVCVLWRGWIDLQRLEGFGCLEFDEYRAYLEDALTKQQIDKQASFGPAPLTNGHHHQHHLHQNHHHHQQHHHHHQAPRLEASPTATAATTTTTPTTTPTSTGQLLAPSCLAGQMIAPPTPLDTTGAHYGNAAIAAAAAAAFHQALAVGGGQPVMPPPVPPPHAMPPLSLPPPPPAAAAGLLPPQAYTDGLQPLSTSFPSLTSIATTTNITASPPTSQQNENNSSSLGNGTTTTTTTARRSTQMQATKRPPEEPAHQTQLDDVDVVSDITTEADFAPPRRIFKPDPLLNHHSNRAARRQGV